jgi:uncharacterized protein
VRVLLDVNVLLSALLARDKPGSTLESLLQGGLGRRYTIVFPDDVADELLRVTARKPHLRRRIQPADVELLTAVLRSVGEHPPPLVPPLPRVCRDPNDDYVVAHAVRNAVDVLVSGDKDLLALDGTGLPFRVLDPCAFLALLEHTEDA